MLLKVVFLTLASSILVYKTDAFSNGAPCIEEVYLTQTPGHGVEVENIGLYKVAVQKLNENQFKVRITATYDMKGLILLAALPDLRFPSGKRIALGSFKNNHDVMDQYCLRFIENGCIADQHAIVTHFYASSCPWRNQEHQCSKFNPCDIDLIWTKPDNVSEDGVRFYLTAVPNRSIYFRAKSVVVLNKARRYDDLESQLDIAAQAQITTRSYIVHKRYPTFPPPPHVLEKQRLIQTQQLQQRKLLVEQNQNQNQNIKKEPTVAAIKLSITLPPLENQEFELLDVTEEPPIKETEGSGEAVGVEGSGEDMPHPTMKPMSPTTTPYIYVPQTTTTTTQIPTTTLVTRKLIELTTKPEEVIQTIERQLSKGPTQHSPFIPRGHLDCSALFDVWPTYCVPYCSGTCCVDNLVFCERTCCDKFSVTLE